MEDIRIIGADKEKTHRYEGELYQVYLELSEKPPTEWVRIFDDIWSGRMLYLMKRPAHVEGKYLVITCGLDEIARHHVPQLKKAFEQTNTGYREYLGREKEEADRSEKEAEEERRQIEETLDSLSFDE